MEPLILYLFKSAVWLSGFGLIFILFLRNERFFLLNRIYLISGIIFSLFMPLITIHYPVYIQEVTGSVPITNSSVVVKNANPSILSLIEKPLLFLYLSGALLVLFLFIKQVGSIVKSLRGAIVDRAQQYKLIRTADFPSSFSFFSFVFINPSVSDIEAKEIINHELVHITQKHWFDLALAEVLCMIQWFNPMMWIYIRYIRQNHEYLADEVALQRTSDQAVYRAVLLNQIVGAPVVVLANNFSYSLNLKRFTMMKNTISSPYRKIKVLFILPVIAIVLYSFAKPEYRYKEAIKQDVLLNIQASDQDTVPAQKLKAPPPPPPPAMKTRNKGSVPPPPPPAMNTRNSGSALPPPPPPPRQQDTIEIVSNGAAPLIVIDGKITDINLKLIDPNSIQSINIIKGIKAIDKYGEKAADGAIEIATKSGWNSNSEKLILKNGKIAERIEVIRYGASPENNSKIVIRSSALDEGAKPLVILDGVVYNQNIDEIDKDDIESISVLKDASATRLYGEKGKDGVIIITSKKK